MYYQAQDAASYTSNLYEASEPIATRRDKRTLTIRAVGICCLALTFLAVRYTLSSSSAATVPLQSFSSSETVMASVEPEPIPAILHPDSLSDQEQQAETQTAIVPSSSLAYPTTVAAASSAPPPPPPSSKIHRPHEHIPGSSTEIREGSTHSGSVYSSDAYETTDFAAAEAEDENAPPAAPPSTQIHDVDEHIPSSSSQIAGGRTRDGSVYRSKKDEKDAKKEKKSFEQQAQTPEEVREKENQKARREADEQEKEAARVKGAERHAEQEKEKESAREAKKHESRASKTNNSATPEPVNTQILAASHRHAHDSDLPAHKEAERAKEKSVPQSPRHRDGQRPPSRAEEKIEEKKQERLNDAKRAEKKLDARKHERRVEEHKREREEEKKKAEKEHDLKRAEDKRDQKKKELAQAEKAAEKKKDQRKDAKSSKARAHAKEAQKDAEKRKEDKEDELKKAARQREARRDAVKEAEKKKEQRKEDHQAARELEKEKEAQIEKDKEKAIKDAKREAAEEHHRQVKAFQSCIQLKCNSVVALLGQNYASPVNQDLNHCLKTNTATDAADKCWSGSHQDDADHNDARAVHICALCQQCIPGSIDPALCEAQGPKTWNDMRGNPYPVAPF